MTWEFRDDRPIYLQIIELIKLKIVSGDYPPGDRIPPVRELAAEAGVNPNTMQKALGELEGEGLIFSQRTSGRFVTEDLKMIDKVKKELAEEQVREFFSKMESIGFSKEETLNIAAQAAGVKPTNEYN